MKLNFKRYCLQLGILLFGIQSGYAVTNDELLKHPILSSFSNFKGLIGSDTEEEIFQWIDLLEAVRDAQDQFVMIEVGAGNGRWGCRGAESARVKGVPFYLGFVEAEPYRCNVVIPDQMKKLGISQDLYRIFEFALGESNSTCLFYISSANQNLDNWLGQSVLMPTDRVKRTLPGQYYGHRLVETVYGYVATEVQQRKFSEVLSAINTPIIDLCDFDIQGNEFIVMRESIDILNARVKSLHIGTHSHVIEADLRNLLLNNEWKLIRDFPCCQVNSTEYGPIKFVDGVQTWHNKRYKNSI